MPVAVLGKTCMSFLSDCILKINKKTNNFIFLKKKKKYIPSVDLVLLNIFSSSLKESLKFHWGTETHLHWALSELLRSNGKKKKKKISIFLIPKANNQNYLHL